ncbi:unnamed protein product [Caenorhabditis auriculariae]|uniref:non-specific serine/threonine protein kinase n=1 Tax=Caenorhabditis auriculariae TaxID=2777116 RepID=A0A8S1GN25_9PELO|nr:unnamed protein product [Caenorhabditis auriculariae]
MGRMNVTAMRYLDAEHFRVLVSVEMGMKKTTKWTLKDLCKHQLCAFERSKKIDGYRLTIRGYDFLALRALTSRSVVGSVGNQIGIGKESDVYVGGDPDLKDLCLKFHRLGRTSFRKVKDKRDYHNKRKNASWLYLSRLAAAKEFAFLKALHERGFPVPTAIDVSRHLVVMQFIEGKTLCNVQELNDPGALYSRCMSLIMKLARHGLIHGDFNEFNIILVEDEKIVMIDFPQMVSIDHLNAEYYFDRDVECIRTFFKRRFDYESEIWPRFSDIERKSNMDVLIEASGFTKKMQNDLNKAYDEGNFKAHEEGENDNSGTDSEDEEDDFETDQGDDESDPESLEDLLEEEESEESEDDVDKEELQAENVEAQQQQIVLSKNSRFNDWLDTATSQVDNIDLNGYQRECFNDVDKADHEAIPCGTVPETTSERLAAQHEPETEETEAAEVPVPRRKKAPAKANSIATSVATFTPEEIKQKVKLDMQRNKQKTRLKVKGKQSAVNRGRKENRDLIGEYAGWI